MFELGILKDFLLPSKFSRFGYAVVVFNLLGEVVLVAVAGALGSREQDKFQCKFSSDKNRQYLLEQCYQNYVSEYNSPLPLWGFVFLELCLVLAVCLIYHCLVTSAFARIFPYGDVEYLDEERPPCSTRSWQVFRLYFVQLFGRLLIATLFTVLQNTVFFPFTFPKEFLCGPMTEEPRKNPNNSKAEYKPISLFPTECLNSLAVEKTVVCVFILLLNIIVFLLVFGEIIYLVFRAFRSNDFIVDTEFRAKYFFNRSSSIDRARDCLKKLTLQQTQSVLLIPLEERRLIDDIFVNLTIQMKKPDGEFFAIHRYDQLYLPIMIDGIVCDARKVLVVGPPGSGKSLLCQKLLRDWGKKTSPDRFDFAFLFKFSWFSSQATCVMSLRELLNRGVPSEGIIEDVFPQLLAHPERILLVFDGFDDLKDCESCTENREAGFENSSTAEIPLSALFLKLLQNKLLRGATLLATSRSDAITSYVASLFERTVKITDFTEENVHQYVDNYYTDSSEAIRIKEEISGNSDLLSLSFMPVFCHIVCYLLKEEGVRLTNIYQKALTFFIFKHHAFYKGKPLPENLERFADSVERTLADLGSVAGRALFNKRKLFGLTELSNDLRKCGLLRRVTDENGTQCLSFIHPAFFDFFAARKIVQMDPAKLKERIIGVLKRDDSKWFFVFQFVAGLLHGLQHEVISGFVKCLHDSLLSSPTNGKTALLIMKCLYEYDNEATVEEAASKLQENSGFNKKVNFGKCHLTSGDCNAIVYFLKHLNLLESVDLSDNYIGSRGCKELAKLVETGGPKNLCLSKDKVSDQDLLFLLQASRSRESNLKTLNVTCI